MNDKRLRRVEEIASLDQYHTPRICEKCGGIMVFKGVGEYRCEDCNALAYDDYGKVRVYLEEHRGAKAAEVEAATGVKQKTIRLMLRESRLEIAEDSKTFLICEKCGQRIRSGRLCPKCEVEWHRQLEEQQRMGHMDYMDHVQGFGLGAGKGEEGEKRFRRR